MHSDSILLMENFKKEFESRFTGKKILDVGSQDINGSYRPIFPDSQYIGLDIREAKGVDVVCETMDLFPLPDNEFDIVVCGQTLEHCFRPWKTVGEIARVLKPGGICCLIAPWRFHVHKDALCPFDCWRILEDGMEVLLNDSGLMVEKVFSYQDDCVGIGIKS